jgi:hypothetical protein
MGITRQQMPGGAVRDRREDQREPEELEVGDEVEAPGRQ